MTGDVGNNSFVRRHGDELRRAPSSSEKGGFSTRRNQDVQQNTEATLFDSKRAKQETFNFSSYGIYFH